MTFINRDFRFSEKKERHPLLRWVIFSVGCVVLGAVIAKTAKITNEASNDLPGLKAEPLYQRGGPKAR